MCLCLLVVGCSASADSPEITAEALLERLGGASAPLVLDVRTSKEFQSGHVPGAVHIPFDEIGSRMSELDSAKSGDVVVYCQSGRRAGMAEAELRAAGFSVLHLSGDMKGWRAQSHPLEMDAPSPD
jgi:rhodanese-related sulfurtransferase